MNKRLLYACRNCNYSEAVTDPRVYKNELHSFVGETAGVTAGLGDDPTLPRSNKECPKCNNTEAVFFQSQARRAETRMTLFFVCVQVRDPLIDTKVWLVLGRLSRREGWNIEGGHI